jgi:hypothetical protein
MSQTGNCSTDDRGPSTPAPTHLIVFEVKGSAAEANVAYAGVEGYHGAPNVPLPWAISFRVDPGARLWLVGNAGDEGSVTCVISEDGQEMVESEPGPVCKLESTS